jgi:hypothetical protein
VGRRIVPTYDITAEGRAQLGKYRALVQTYQRVRPGPGPGTNRQPDSGGPGAD